MRSDDLTPLLTRKNGQDLGFRTGVVLTWDPLTGENTISVAGAVLEDLSILNNTDVVAIAAGDTVALVRFQNAYFIMGRIIAPGENAGLAGAASRSEGYHDFASNFAIPTATTGILSRNITVPAGFSHAVIVVAWSLTFAALNDAGMIGVTLARTGESLAFQYVEKGRWQTIAATKVDAGPVTPGQVITVDARLSSSPQASAAAAGNHLSMDTVVIWTRD